MRLHGFRAIVCALLVAIVAAAPTASADAPASSAAAKQPQFVLWSGGMGPEDVLRGFRLYPNGKAEALEAIGEERTRVVQTFTPNPQQLNALRAAARAAAKSPTVTEAEAPEHSYTSATIKIGKAKPRTVLGVNTTPSGLARLVDAVNATQPAERRIYPRRLARAATWRNPPRTAPCQRGTATDFKRKLTLKQAAEAGAVDLTSKGGFGGDVVAIDAEWDRVPAKAPVKVEIKIEFIRESLAPTIQAIEAGIERRLAGLKTAAGTPVEFDVVAKERLDHDLATPCFHQIRIGDVIPRSYVTGADGRPSVHPSAGEWSYDDGNDVFAHEALHLAGLDDHYENVFRSGNRDVPVPENVDSGDKAALEAWARSQGLDTNTGRLYGRPKKGHENDITANLKGTVLDPDLQKFVDWVDFIEIHGEAGDVLVSKKNPDELDTGEQNLLVGSDFDIEVRRGEHERRDGIVAYCMDLNRHTPSEGTKYDVLGNAADMPHPAMQALFQIAQEIDRRQPEELMPTPGAQSAVWRVTNDNGVFFDEEAEQILGTVGIEPNGGQIFEAPHFVNPNAANPRTGSVSETAVEQAELHSPRAPDAPPAAPVLQSVKVTPGKVKSGSKGLGNVLTVGVSLAQAGDSVQVTLQRVKGRKVTTVKSYGAKELDEGEQTFGLVLPRKLKPGTYQVTVEGASGKQSGTFKVRKARKTKPKRRKG